MWQTAAPAPAYTKSLAPGWEPKDLLHVGTVLCRSSKAPSMPGASRPSRSTSSRQLLRRQGRAGSQSVLVIRAHIWWLLLNVYHRSFDSWGVTGLVITVCSLLMGPTCWTDSLAGSNAWQVQECQSLSPAGWTRFGRQRLLLQFLRGLPVITIGPILGVGVCTTALCRQSLQASAEKSQTCLYSA